MIHVLVMVKFSAEFLFPLSHRIHVLFYNKLVKKIFPNTFSYMYMYAHIQFFLKGGGVKGMAVFAEGMVVQGLLYTVYIIYD